jgi:hypothetical protein
MSHGWVSRGAHQDEALLTALMSIDIAGLQSLEGVSAGGARIPGAVPTRVEKSSLRANHWGDEAIGAGGVRLDRLQGDVMGLLRLQPEGHR